MFLAASINKGPGSYDIFIEFVHRSKIIFKSKWVLFAEFFNRIDEKSSCSDSATIEFESEKDGGGAYKTEHVFFLCCRILSKNISKVGMPFSFWDEVIVLLSHGDWCMLALSTSGT